MLTHDWPIPDNVAIVFTDRHGGYSEPPFDSLNLGMHVGDNPHKVLANRRVLVERYGLPAEPLWLNQVHGTKMVCESTLSDKQINQVPSADGSFSNQYGQVCVVMTADCLPVLLCDKQGTQVAAVHAGWRGLCDGIIEQALTQFSQPSSDIIAYLGAAIGPEKFEVGAEVKHAFMRHNPQAESCFKMATSSTLSTPKYLADIVALAKLRLKAKNVTSIYSSDICTVSDENYFSYRRDHQTGRMASLIWLKS
ncbi:peptidoglycan editing factor PgeF [Shewanella aestuarii]|uniref:Purine nucleoside phosphorylase n=1 Tax=Shewanella aestuarii TaxID=1028752 RepID=A0A6G9QN68_9GAMM|nr:peptidoglycan editing factor PgeF [Shewanella aestuarii]QIR15515.1 peptidoglycan editing factor PgeF [Shewanella aestuarii]